MWKLLLKLIISSTATNMKGKFTKKNLKVESNSDDRFVIDKSKLWCEVNKVFLNLLLFESL